MYQKRDRVTTILRELELVKLDHKQTLSESETYDFVNCCELTNRSVMCEGGDIASRRVIVKHPWFIPP